MISEIAPRSHGRVAVVFTHGESEWMSCQTILPNLLNAYRSAFKDNLNIFYVRRNMSDLDVLLLAKEIAATRPVRVVLLDHLYHPTRLVAALDLAWQGVRPPPVFIHLYGNFTRLSPDWWHLNSILKKNRIRLVCASSRHADLVGRILSDSSVDPVATCPFPVDDAKFNYLPELRVAERRRLGISREERVFFISGRIAPEKGVVLAARAFLSATRGAKMPSRLLVAGKIEKGGPPLFSTDSARADTGRMEWSHFMESLPDSDRKRIQYRGLLKQDELVAFYNASDVGLSMSMYHDEDFGMAPVEALFTGARMIISSWGGYASLKDDFGYCSTIPVRLSPAAPISEATLRHQIRRQLHQPLEDEARRKISALFRQRYSIHSVSEVIKKIHGKTPRRFPGFGDRMYQLAIRMLAHRNRFPAFPEGRRAETFYEEIYGAYYDERR